MQYALFEQQPPLSNRGVTFQGWSAGIDWVTLTSEANRGQELWADSQVLTGLIEGYGTEKMATARIRDYTGYSIPGVVWAQRKAGTFRQVTSHLADQYMWSVHNAGIDITQMSCTRLDVRLDITLTNDTASYVSSIAQERATSGDHTRKGKPLLISSYGDGDTFYVGSPSSDRRLRIYDKWKESGDDKYRNVVRYELQLRSSLAQQLYQLYRADKDTERTLASTVAHHCERVNVYIPRVDFNTDPIPLSTTPRATAIEEQLEWLRKQVAPTVRRLVAAGYENEVLAALGLLTYNTGTEETGVKDKQTHMSALPLLGCDGMR